MDSVSKILYCENQFDMKKSLFDALDEAFQKEVSQAKSYPEAFERATEKFEQRHGFSVPFTGYDSFRKTKEYLRKRSTRNR